MKNKYMKTQVMIKESTQIEDCAFSVRAFNVLKAHRMNTVGDIVGNMEKLPSLHMVGPSVLRELLNCIKLINVPVPMSDADRADALQKWKDSAMKVLTEISEYLSDRHLQGGKSAIAINTISTNSIFHKNIIQLINHA